MSGCFHLLMSEGILVGQQRDEKTTTRHCVCVCVYIFFIFYILKLYLNSILNILRANLNEFNQANEEINLVCDVFKKTFPSTSIKRCV